MLTTKIRRPVDACDVASEAAGRLRVAIGLLARRDDFVNSFNTDGWETEVLRSILEEVSDAMMMIADADLGQPVKENDGAGR